MLTCLFAIVPVQAAHATFHEVMVSEVYSGSAAQPESSFVELQMWSPEQNLVGGHTVTLYDATGGVVVSFGFPSDLPGKGVDQQTMLVGDSGVGTAFGVTPDLSNASFNIPAGGGAVCWDGLDCVSWGNFGAHTAPSSGIPSDPAGVPDGKALVRRISGGNCGNLLDPADDTNDSDSEFTDGTPTPQSYATVPPPATCAPPPPAPAVLIDSKPPSFTNLTAATFSFHASIATGFECRLDQGPYKDCASGSINYPGPLTEAMHNFRVRASNGSNVGAPTSYSWTVDLTAPTSNITSHPVDPSPGNSASFRYGSTTGGSKFECELSPIEVSFKACDTQPTVYSSLADGEYKFEVRAIDAAGNLQVTPTSFSWTVNNALLDETPPETAILSKPPDPSTSPAASFTYSSTEPGSSFECKLDSGNFSICPTSGIVYSGLSDGSHVFQVRAIDQSQNIDTTPAGYSFAVVLSGSTRAGSTSPTPGSRAARPALNTTIAKLPTRTRDRTPTFRFASNKSQASFQCKLDSGPFHSCRSPLTTKKLSLGPHLLQVRALLNGTSDPSPAKFNFKIVKG